MTSTSLYSDNLKTLNAAQLLSRINGGVDMLYRAKTISDLKLQYRVLSSVWHPDHNPGAASTEIFQHIKRLFDNALERIKNGQPVGIKEIVLKSDKSDLIVSYKAKHSFELGEAYAGSTHTTYVLSKEYESLINAAQLSLKSCVFSTPAMKAQISPSIPSISKIIKTIDDKIAVIVEKPKGFYPLSDVVRYLGGTVPATHTAWVMSGLYNLSCYFHHIGLTHNGIDMNSVYINPLTHQVAIIGGWWYSAALSGSLKALNADALSLSTAKSLKDKKPDPALDQKLIAQLGLDMLGSRSLYVLEQNPSIPSALSRWLARGGNSNSGGNGTRIALDNYKAWQTVVLPESFGVRKFIELNITEKDLYE